ncbi:hypothetical protein [Achromobacter deleyi]|uniref:hypothetical protein n=1 Tax=Achromobacter deleyi TaxID=1353891 RepID=UPI001E4B1A9B|nr:hypothetical protein [Achromobacter deleyi]
MPAATVEAKAVTVLRSVVLLLLLAPRLSLMLTPPALSIELLDLADEFAAIARVLLDAFAPALGLGYMGSHRRLTQNRTKSLNS